MNWNNIIRHTIPHRLKKNREEHRKARLLIIASIAATAISIVYLLIFSILGYSEAILICLYGAGSSLFLFWIFRLWSNLLISAYFFLFTVNTFFIAFILTSGGMFSPMAAWLATVPMLAFMILNQRAGYIWSLISIAEIVILFVLSLYDIHFPALFPLKWFEAIHFVAFLGLLLYVIVIIWVYERERHLSIWQIRKAQDQLAKKNKKLKLQKADIEKQNAEISYQHDLLEDQNEKMLDLNNQLEYTVSERTEKLSKINDELGSFLYRASHDLRRPLMSVLGLLELMQMETENEENLDLFKKLRLTTLNMDKMLKKLNMISDVHHETSALVKIDFKQMLDKITKSLAQSIQEFQIQLNIVISPNIEFYSSANLLEYILFNLIENAIIFRNNDKTTHIQVNVEASPRKVEIQVTDNGIGIPDEIKNKVFRMFFKGSVISQGNGLGLHIVKKAVEKLEGKIHLQSEEGIGTSFSIAFVNPFA